MNPSEYPVLGVFSNDTDNDLSISLEMLCEEIILSPGHSIELLAAPSNNLLPLSICYCSNGIQIYPHKEFDPDWYIRFNGKLIKPAHPTKLSEWEQ